jgi:hypothetical protein
MGVKGNQVKCLSGPATVTVSLATHATRFGEGVAK